MKLIRRYLPLLALPLLYLPHANAQSSIDFNLGFGTAQAKSLGRVDINTLLSCNTSGNSCVPTPDLGNVFMGIGGNLMLWKHFGVGMNAKFQPGKQDYLIFQQQSTGQFGDILQSRVTFYDFNGILQPIATKRAALQLQGGIGGANVKFYEKLSSSSSVLGNANSTQFFGSSNHFQLHAGLGVQLYLTDHVFVRPQFDLHYVHNFSQYGRNAVTSEMIYIGYSIGDR